MKYSEFRKLINDKGLEIFDGGSVLVTCPNTERVYMMIDKDNTHKLTTSFSKFSELSVCDKQILLDWAIKLASTPLDEREDEKRYRLKLPFVSNDHGYLNLYDNPDNRTSLTIFIGDRHNVSKHKTIFTESEIQELKRKYNLDSFVLEGVKEDE